MKTAIFLTLAVICLFSLPGCGKEKAEEVKEAPTAAEIVDTYVDKLTTAPGLARDAAGVANERTEAEEKALKALE